MEDHFGETSAGSSRMRPTEVGGLGRRSYSYVRHTYSNHSHSEHCYSRHSSIKGTHSKNTRFGTFLENPLDKYPPHSYSCRTKTDQAEINLVRQSTGVNIDTETIINSIDMGGIATTSAGVNIDMEAIASTSASVSKDMDSIASNSAGVNIDIEAIARMSAGVNKDMDTIARLSAGVKKDMDTIARLSAGVNKDVEVIARLSAGVNIDMEAIASNIVTHKQQEVGKIFTCDPQLENESLKDQAVGTKVFTCEPQVFYMEKSSYVASLKGTDVEVYVEAKHREIECGGMEITEDATGDNREVEITQDATGDCIDVKCVNTEAGYIGTLEATGDDCIEVENDNREVEVTQASVAESGEVYVFEDADGNVYYAVEEDGELKIIEGVTNEDDMEVEHGNRESVEGTVYLGEYNEDLSDKAECALESAYTSVPVPEYSNVQSEDAEYVETVTLDSADEEFYCDYRYIYQHENNVEMNAGYESNTKYEEKGMSESECKNQISSNTGCANDAHVRRKMSARKGRPPNITRDTEYENWRKRVFEVTQGVPMARTIRDVTGTNKFVFTKTLNKKLGMRGRVPTVTTRRPTTKQTPENIEGTEKQKPVSKKCIDKMGVGTVKEAHKRKRSITEVNVGEQTGECNSVRKQLPGNVRAKKYKKIRKKQLKNDNPDIVTSKKKKVIGGSNVNTKIDSTPREDEGSECNEVLEGEGGDSSSSQARKDEGTEGNETLEGGDSSSNQKKGKSRASQAREKWARKVSCKRRHSPPSRVKSRKRVCKKKDKQSSASREIKARSRQADKTYNSKKFGMSSCGDITKYRDSSRTKHDGSLTSSNQERNQKSSTNVLTRTFEDPSAIYVIEECNESKVGDLTEDPLEVEVECFKEELKDEPIDDVMMRDDTMIDRTLTDGALIDGTAINSPTTESPVAAVLFRKDVLPDRTLTDGALIDGTAINSPTTESPVAAVLDGKDVLPLSTGSLAVKDATTLRTYQRKSAATPSKNISLAVHEGATGINIDYPSPNEQDRLSPSDTSTSGLFNEHHYSSNSKTINDNLSDDQNGSSLSNTSTGNLPNTEKNVSISKTSTSNLSNVNPSTDNLSTSNLSTSNLSTSSLSTVNSLSGNLPNSNLSTSNLSTSNLSNVNPSTDNLSTSNLSTSSLSTVNSSTGNLPNSVRPTNNHSSDQPSKKRPRKEVAMEEKESEKDAISDEVFLEYVRLTLNGLDAKEKRQVKVEVMGVLSDMTRRLKR